MSDRSGRGYLTRSVKAGQRLPHLIGIRLDGTGTASILEGSNEATLVDNGTGDYTLTFAQSFARVPVVVATTLTADSVLQINTITASALNILAFDATDGTTAKDVDMHIMILGFDAADEV